MGVSEAAGYLGIGGVNQGHGFEELGGLGGVPGDSGLVPGDALGCAAAVDGGGGVDPLGMEFFASGEGEHVVHALSEGGARGGLETEEIFALGVGTEGQIDQRPEAGSVVVEGVALFEVPAGSVGVEVVLYVDGVLVSGPLEQVWLVEGPADGSDDFDAFGLPVVAGVLAAGGAVHHALGDAAHPFVKCGLLLAGEAMAKGGIAGPDGIELVVVDGVCAGYVAVGPCEDDGPCLVGVGFAAGDLPSEDEAFEVVHVFDGPGGLDSFGVGIEQTFVAKGFEGGGLVLEGEVGVADELVAEDADLGIGAGEGP